MNFFRSLLVIAFGLLQAGCFVSEAPLFESGAGVAVFGEGRLNVSVESGNRPAQNVVLSWNGHGYIDESKPNDPAMTFHRMPDPPRGEEWFVAQGKLTDTFAAQGLRGYIYITFKKEPVEPDGEGVVLLQNESSCMRALKLQKADGWEQVSPSQVCKVESREDVFDGLLGLVAEDEIIGTYTATPLGK